MSIAVKIILIVLIILGLAGAILFIYQGQPLPLLNQVVTIPVLEKKPQVLLEEMSRSLEQTTTATYTMTHQQQFSIQDQSITMTSTLNHFGQVYPLWRGTSTLRFEFELQGVRFRTMAELRATDDWVFVGFREFPAIPFLDIRTLDNTWYKFPNHWSDYTQTHHPVRISDYVSSINRTADVSLNNINMYCLHGKISSESLSQAWGVSVPQSLEAVPITLFIGKADQRLYRMEIELPTQPIIISLSDFEQPVSVTEPADAKTFESFWSDAFVKTNILDLPLFGSLIGVDVGDGTSDADLDGLYTFWERLMGTNPTQADTDGDGFTDTEELRHGYNPLGAGRLAPFPANN